MISVSVKLTLLVLVLPIMLIFSFFIAGFYFYRADIGASGFFTAMSSLLSAVLVVLLVWERLRESGQRKLTWTHDNILFKLYKIFKNEIPYFWYEEVMRLSNDLDKYGEFLSIDLYPKNLLYDIEECVHSGLILHKDLEEIKQTATKLGLTDMNMLYHFLGIDPHRYKSAFSPNDPNLPKYQEKSSLILKEKTKVINEIKTLDEKIVAMEKKITQKLESFMKTNALRLKEVTTPYPFYRY